MAVGSFFYNASIETPVAESWNGTAWTVQPTAGLGFDTGSFSGVSCPAPTACVAVGITRSLGRGPPRPLAEAWNGTSWTVKPTPNPSGRDGYLKSVSCTSPTACTAVGYSLYPSGDSHGASDLLIEQWDGTAWTMQSAPTPVASESALSGVSCTSASACTAVGWYVDSATGKQVTLVERWNGAGWVLQPSPNPSGMLFDSLTSVSCSSAIACTAVGSYVDATDRTLTLAESWNGAAWTIQPTPNPSSASKTELSGVSCASATACNAVGKFTDSSGTTSSLGETWDGAAWTIQPTPNPSGSQSGHLAGVACTSPTACIAAGGNRDGAGVAVTLAEAWDGTAWTVQSTPNPNGGDAWSDLPGVSCTSASACTAVGSYSSVNAPERILAEGWNGAAWTIQAPPNPSGSPSTSLSAVSCAGATTCIAVGDYHDPATATLMTLAERWDGTAWTIQPTPNPAGSGASSLVGVSCASATSCVAVGSSRVGAFGDTVPLAEHWDGAAWTIQPTPMPGGASRVVLSGVSCTSAAACTAVGQSGGQWALVERWDGTAWTIQPTPNPIGGTYSGLSGVSCPGATACTAVGTYAAGGSPSTLAESWDGTAWAVQPTPVPAGSHDSALSGVSCPTAGLCAAVGRSRDSLGTTVSLAERWDGTAWTIQPTPNPSGSRTNELSGVSCTAPTACAASGDARDSAGTPVTLTERYGR